MTEEPVFCLWVCWVFFVVFFVLINMCCAKESSKSGRDHFCFYHSGTLYGTGFFSRGRVLINTMGLWEIDTEAEYVSSRDTGNKKNDWILLNWNRDIWKSFWNDFWIQNVPFSHETFPKLVIPLVKQCSFLTDFNSYSNWTSKCFSISSEASTNSY